MLIQGGQQRHNKGRKTPGGVFIALLRQREDVCQPSLEKVVGHHNDSWQSRKRRKQMEKAAKNENNGDLDLIG